MPTNNADIGTLLPQEIIDMILPNLTKRDLAIASRVCTSWLKIFSPVLWQDLKIDSDYTLDRFLSSVMEGALIRNGHYIRTLDTAHYSVIESFATLGRTCTNLTEISVEIKPPPDFGKTLPLTSFIGSAASARSTTFFGSSTPASSTSLFGSPAPAPSTTFFGSAASAPSTPSFGSTTPAPSTTLFGSTTPAPSTSLFGSPAPAPSTIFFGSSTPASSTSLFGSPAPAPSTTIFGSAASAPSTPSFGSTTPAPSTSLFGSPAPAPSTTFFGSSTPASSTSLFGLTTPAPSTSLFGSPAPAPSSSLLGSTTPAPSTSLFGPTMTAPSVTTTPLPPIVESLVVDTATLPLPSSSPVSSPPHSLFGVPIAAGITEMSSVSTINPVSTSAFSFGSPGLGGFGATSTAHTTSTLAFGQKQPSTQFGYANAVSAGSSVLPLSRTRTPFNDSHDPETSFARLLLVLQRNKNLKSLRLNGDLVGESRDNHGRGTGFYRILATLPETLESLTFMNVDLGYDFSFGDLLAPTRPPLYHGLKPEVSTLGPLPSLTTLQVSHALNNRSLCSLLSRCPALEALRIAGLERFKIPKVAEILKAECPNLTELFLVPPPRHRPGLKDEELAELLSASRLGWKTLGLGSAMERMNERCSVAKVLESAPTLENLWVEGSGGLLSNDIQFMLSHGPQLKRLLLLNEDRGYGIYDHYISAEDMIRSPWVCGDTLESLKVMIKGVPRPELEKRTNKRPFSEEEKAAFRRGYPRINQGLLYDRLAQLKNLQELVLGVDVESSFSLYVADRGIEGEFSDTNNIQIAFQYDCMEMSLSSGLDRLRDLKNLRRLDLSRMAVKFYEAEEQAWVKKHWPRYGQVEKDDFWTRRKKAMGVYEIYY